MRTIEGHKVNPANDTLTITVLDEPGSGGAHHLYRVTGFSKDNPGGKGPLAGGAVTIAFQNGPIAEAGVNGLTHEVLLEILIDRLKCFQAGPFANGYNASALLNLEAAQLDLQARTLERMSRGVEGTHKA